MTQEVFPEIQAATEALKTRITLTETEVAQMKDGIKAKRELLRSWRKALAAFSPKRKETKKRITSIRLPPDNAGTKGQLLEAALCATA